MRVTIPIFLATLAACHAAGMLRPLSPATPVAPRGEWADPMPPAAVMVSNIRFAPPENAPGAIGGEAVPAGAVGGGAAGSAAAFPEADPAGGFPGGDVLSDKRIARRLLVLDAATAAALGSGARETASVEASDWGLAPGAPVLPTPVTVDRAGPSSPPAAAVADQPAGPAARPGPELLPPATLAAVFPSDASLSPNLYLPDGAVNEEGALLTLIRNGLTAHELPDAASPPVTAPMREGTRVRPLTRLRGETGFDWIKIREGGRECWAQAEFFIRVDPRNRTGGGEGARNLPLGSEVVDRDSALPPDYRPDDLVAAPREIVLDPKEIRLRAGTATALETMVRAAESDGVQLRLVSGFRDFATQKRLYLEAIDDSGAKQNGVAPPGYSEHQLGTTVDLSGSDRRALLSGRFAETREGRWLAANAARFGFRNSYTRENADESGYKPEPWHFRQVGQP